MNRSVRSGHPFFVAVMLALFVAGCVFQAFIA